MSRILEFQPTDEQTIVARVLVELHRALDQAFPETAGSSKQFSKTVLAPNAPANAAASEQRSSLSTQTAGQSKAAGKAKPDPDAKPTGKDRQTGHLSGHPSHMKDHATVMQEARWSKLLTMFLVLLLCAGCALLAWIYLFGPPTF